MRATAIDAKSATKRLMITVKKTTMTELRRALVKPSFVTAST
jgi:hypothetical protein